MKYLLDWKIFESNKEKITKVVRSEIRRFKNKWEIELDPKFTTQEIKLISEGLEYYKTGLIKGKIQKIIRKDLGAVHGRWKDTEKKKWMYLNPSIFKFKRRWKDEDTDIPYSLFTIVHEIAHCIDHVEKVSFSKNWQAISGWKKCAVDEKVPDGYTRYIEKRKGRSIDGKKKSHWIHKEGADFCRKYSSKNPREDFADSLAFYILGFPEKLGGECGKKKIEIIKELHEIN